MSLEEAFLTKIEDHKGVIFKIAKMYQSNFEDRNDLYQEIIFQAWKAYPKFRGDSKFSTWLYRVALNTAITFLKEEKKSILVQDNDKIKNYKAPAEAYSSEKEEKLALMYRAIEQLSPIDKALIFYYLQGYSGEEMAKELGVSQGNTRVKLNRAKQKLKTIIDSQK